MSTTSAFVAIGLLFAGLGLVLVTNALGAADRFAKVQIIPRMRSARYARFVGAIYLAAGLIFAGMALTLFR